MDRGEIRPMMLLVLFFTVVPAIEVMLFILVGGKVGLLNTILVVLLVGITGAALARAEGTKVLLEIREALAQGRLPGKELLEGALVIAAGALLLTPGFFTDILALLLLLPGSRHLATALLLGWFRRRMAAGGSAAEGPPTTAGAWVVTVGSPRPVPGSAPPLAGREPPTLDASFEVHSDDTPPKA